MNNIFKFIMVLLSYFPARCFPMGNLKKQGPVLFSLSFRPFQYNSIILLKALGTHNLNIFPLMATGPQILYSLPFYYLGKNIICDAFLGKVGFSCTAVSSCFNKLELSKAKQILVVILGFQYRTMVYLDALYDGNHE